MGPAIDPNDIDMFWAGMDKDEDLYISKKNMMTGLQISAEAGNNQAQDLQTDKGRKAEKLTDLFKCHF